MEKGQVTYKDSPISIITGFLTETLKARKALIEVMQTLRQYLPGEKPQLS